MTLAARERAKATVAARRPCDRFLATATFGRAENAGAARTGPAGDALTDGVVSGAVGGALVTVVSVVVVVPVVVVVVVVVVPVPVPVPVPGPSAAAWSRPAA